MIVFRVILGLIVKEACPVGSCPATMEVAVHLQQEGHAAPACLVMVEPSVSIVARKGAHPSPAEMEDCALKRPVSHSFTVSVPMVGQVNAASRATDPLSPRHLHAPWQTVIVKLVMAFATRNATHSLVAGMAVTVL